SLQRRGTRRGAERAGFLVVLGAHRYSLADRPDRAAIRREKSRFNGLTGRASLTQSRRSGQQAGAASRFDPGHPGAPNMEIVDGQTRMGHQASLPELQRRLLRSRQVADYLPEMRYRVQSGSAGEDPAAGAR